MARASFFCISIICGGSERLRNSVIAVGEIGELSLATGGRRLCILAMVQGAALTCSFSPSFSHGPCEGAVSGVCCRSGTVGWWTLAAARQCRRGHGRLIEARNGSAQWSHACKRMQSDHKDDMRKRKVYVPGQGVPRQGGQYCKLVGLRHKYVGDGREGSWWRRFPKGRSRPSRMTDL